VEKKLAEEKVKEMEAMIGGEQIEVVRLNLELKRQLHDCEARLQDLEI